MLALKMTQAEFDAWRDPEVRAEFVEGSVEVSSPESTRADELRNFLGFLLTAVVRRAHVGRVFGPNVVVRLRAGLRRVPDLLLVPNDRLEHILENAVACPRPWRWRLRPP